MNVMADRTQFLGWLGWPGSLFGNCLVTKHPSLESRITKFERNFEDANSELLRMREDFNLRGVLEQGLRTWWSNKSAKSRPGQIPPRFPGVNEAITHLYTAQPSLKSTIKSECSTRSVRYEDVASCIDDTLYHLLSEHTHGHGNTVTQAIVLDRKMFGVAEIAAVVSVLRYLDQEGALGVV